MREAFVKLHISILLAGCTGLFGKLIQLHETEIVGFRMILASLLMLALYGLPKLPFRKVLRASAALSVLALHWMLFYCSIKVSNVCIGVLCFSTTGGWTLLVESLVRRRWPTVAEIIWCLMAVAGVGCIYFLSPDTAAGAAGGDVQRGILIGLLSSLVCGIYTVMSKAACRGMETRDFLQCGLLGGLVALTVLIPIYLQAFGLPLQTVLKAPSRMDWVWMLCHASFCTVAMYLLQLAALRRLSAFTVNLSYNLEPVYSILFAMLFLGEAVELHRSFYLGLALVALSVVMQSIVVAQKRKRDAG
ncbi:MAG: DMT family transporter [Kiritimatiellae bacterium]|nr:DMT family transporter [Kiritimatiellia bacterium]